MITYIKMYSNYSDEELNKYTYNNIGILYSIIKDIRDKENSVKFGLIDYEFLINAEPTKQVGKETQIDKEKIKENIKKAKEIKNFYLGVENIEDDNKDNLMVNFIKNKKGGDVKIKQLSKKAFKNLIKKHKKSKLN